MPTDEVTIAGVAYRLPVGAYVNADGQVFNADGGQIALDQLVTVAPPPPTATRTQRNPDGTVTAWWSDGTITTARPSGSFGQLGAVATSAADAVGDVWQKALDVPVLGEALASAAVVMTGGLAALDKETRDDAVAGFKAGAVIGSGIAAGGLLGGVQAGAGAVSDSVAPDQVAAAADAPPPAVVEQPAAGDVVPLTFWQWLASLFTGGTP